MKYILAALLLACSFAAQPAAVLVAATGNIVITLTDEPCAFKQFSNLPRRATWREGNKVYEGCYNAHFETKMIGAYFDDGSFSIIPMAIFTWMAGA